MSTDGSAILPRAGPTYVDVILDILLALFIANLLASLLPLPSNILNLPTSPLLLCLHLTQP